MDLTILHPKFPKQLQQVRYVTGSLTAIVRLCIMVCLSISSAKSTEEFKESQQFLHDDAKTFLRVPQQAAKLEEKLREFDQKHRGQSPLHVITTTSTSCPGSVFEFSNDRRKALLRDDKGFVLVYEVDSGKFNLSMRSIEEDSYQEDWQPSIVPQHVDLELQANLEKRVKTTRARKQLQKAIAGYDPADSCVELSTAFMDTYDEFALKVPEEKQSILLIVFASIILFAAFITAIRYQGIVSAKLAEEKIAYRFPVRQRPTPLGSAHGGEHCSIKFG